MRLLLKPGPRPGPRSRTMKEPGPRKTCNLKNLDDEKCGKQRDVEKKLGDHYHNFINTG